MRLAALIFDVDGTLAETEELHREAFNAAFAAAGLGWVWDRALYARLLEVTGGKERIAHYQELVALELAGSAGPYGQAGPSGSAATIGVAAPVVSAAPDGVGAPAGSAETIGVAAPVGSVAPDGVGARAGSAGPRGADASVGLAAPLESGEIAALHAEKTARYAARVATGGLALRPGVRRLLEEARAAGVRLAIATTTSRANVDALLAACGDLPAFDVIVAGDEVARKKPAPDVYEAALARLALPAAACVAIEDTVNGLLSAQGAGLRCLMTVSVYGGAGPFAGAAATVSDLGEPGAPCTVLQGAALATAGWVDLRYMEGLQQAG